MKRIGILLSAGESRRMGFDKLTTPIAGDQTAILLSARALVSGGCEALVMPCSGASRIYAESLSLSVPIYFADGGETRQASVKNALLRVKSLIGEEAVVAIHDAARCFVAPAVVRACLASAEEHGSGIAVTAMTDTVFQREDAALYALDRAKLVKMLTPQAFRLNEILSGYLTVDAPATDDCTLYVASGKTPHFVEGGADNIKLTTPEDWTQAKLRLMAPLRVGMGFDTHQLVEGRKLILGGVELPYEKGLLGHSDADVLIHALIDALLGAAALGDIGALFPDTEKRYKDIDSRLLLRAVRERLIERGFSICNVDVTVLCERPKLRPYIDAMRNNIAADLNIDMSYVSIKATTTEGMNDEGRRLCISAQAVATVR